MATSLPFYQNLLGLQVWWDQIEDGPVVEAITGVPGVRLHTVKLKAPEGGSVELLQYLNTPSPVPPQTTSNTVGCNHVAMQVGNLDELYREAVAAGIVFNCPPAMTPGGKAKVTYCRDPEGVILELVEILG